MKKLILVLTIFILSLISMSLLVGCALFETNTDSAKENLKQLIYCLDAKDHDGVKALFAPNRINDIQDFDSDIDELLSCYEGQFVTHDFDTPATFDDIDNGIKKKWFIIGANITTNKGSFHIVMYWCDMDTSNKDNVGIWSLYIFNKADNPLNDFSFYPEGTWNDWSGITVVKSYKNIEMIMNIIQNKDATLIGKMFASSVSDSVSNVDISELMSYYIGEFSSCNVLATDEEILLDASGKIAQKHGLCSYNIFTTTGTYKIALKYCEKDVTSEDNLGIESLYICKVDNTNLGSPYWGDGLWTSGINIEKVDSSK